MGECGSHGVSFRGLWMSDAAFLFAAMKQV